MDLIAGFNPNLNTDCCIFFLIAARFFGAMVICPIFSDGIVPRMIKIVLAGSFALVVLPVYLHNNINIGGLQLVALLVKEICVGALIGYIFSIPIWLVENVGNIIDIQRGEQFGAEIDPMTKNPSSSIAKLLNQSFMVYLISAGGIALLVRFIFFSFSACPPTEYFVRSVVLLEALKVFYDYFYWVIVLCLPVIFVLFLLDMILGLLSSFVQQLNVTIFAMTLKSVLALLVVIPYVTVVYHFAFERLINEVLLFKI